MLQDSSSGWSCPNSSSSVIYVHAHLSDCAAYGPMKSCQPSYADFCGVAIGSYIRLKTLDALSSHDQVGPVMLPDPAMRRNGPCECLMGQP